MQRMSSHGSRTERRLARRWGVSFVCVLLGACTDTSRAVQVVARTDFESATRSARSYVCAVGDVDRDGVSDLAFGAVGRDGDAGTLTLVSWSTGKKIWQVAGEQDASDFGRSVVCVGDLDGDGIDDLAVGQPEAGEVGVRPRYSILTLRSGQSSKVLLTCESEHPSDGLGYFMLPTDDADGDGAADLLVGAPTRYRGSLRSGAVDLRSSRTLKLVREIRLTQPNNLGFSFALVDDIDGGGQRDIVAIALGAATAVAVSVERGTALWTKDFDCEAVEILGSGKSSVDGSATVLLKLRRRRQTFRSSTELIAISGATGDLAETLGSGEACVYTSVDGSSMPRYLVASVGSGIECIPDHVAARTQLTNPEIGRFLERQVLLDASHFLGDLDGDGTLEIAVVGRQLDRHSGIVDWSQSSSSVLLVSVPSIRR